MRQRSTDRFSTRFIVILIWDMIKYARPGLMDVGYQIAAASHALAGKTTDATTMMYADNYADGFRAVDYYTGKFYQSQSFVSCF
ncbi:hypothetical protein [Caproicibacter sp.]|uniref:hypothetical protein n=1 Tax=Caproicibacter sp. TaxID=2814884 RepID=UPI003989B392